MNPITQDMGSAQQPAGADRLPDPLVRAEHYRVLAAAFAYPDAEELATLLAEAEQELDQFIGLEEVKTQVARLKSSVAMGLLRQERGLAVAVAHHHHSVGTALDRNVELVIPLPAGARARVEAASATAPSRIESETTLRGMR